MDILILSNGPGEVTTWVKPIVRALRKKLGDNRSLVRISVVLSPCPNATGKEAEIARSYPEVDRVQSAEHFFRFLLWGVTADNWDWHDKGVVVFLGGDQIFPVVIGSRLGYRKVVYAEWDTRWHRWIDSFGVMQAETIAKAPKKYSHKLAVVGDLMADVGMERQGAEGAEGNKESISNSQFPIPNSQFPIPTELIGLLPGSKSAKLTQGVPLSLAIAEYIYSRRPQTRFVIPVAPTLDINTLASFADPQQNSLIRQLGWAEAELVQEGRRQEAEGRREGSLYTNFFNHSPYLKTATGLRVELWQEFPAHELLSQCRLCLTTVGANTAELGSLAVPMIVLLPAQQLDAMRAWDGLPSLLANLPGVGTSFAKLINWVMLQLVLRYKRLFAWPNIWAKEEIVPELVGNLQPQEVAELALDWLEHPEKLEQICDRLRKVRGKPGAAEKLAQLVGKVLENS
ncbi:MAG: lipid-A-disaccharide synthase [Symploca sp. SIO2C1]|nr:lipid-A-disaccharide synthase [Symploca sp. SIO2C1]